MLFSFHFVILILFNNSIIGDALSKATNRTTAVKTTTVRTRITLRNNVTTPASTSARPAASTIPTTTRRPLIQGIRLPCLCAAGQCGCCTGYILDRFNQKACLNITYEPDDFALTTSVSLNDRVWFKRTISGKNPPPFCIRLPRFEYIRFCVQFSNVYIADRNIHLCIDAEANWQDFTLVDWSFDCIRMGISGVAVVRPEEGGGLPAYPIDVVDQTDEDYDDNAKSLLTYNNADDFQFIFDSNLKQLSNIKVPDKKYVKIDRTRDNKIKISFRNV